MLLRLINPAVTHPTTPILTNLSTPRVECHAHISANGTLNQPTGLTSTGPAMTPLTAFAPSVEGDRHPSPVRQAPEYCAPRHVHLHAAPIDGGEHSWASGETLPVTPNSLLQKFKNKMPIGAATSTDVSASIGNESHEHSPHPTPDPPGRSGTCHPSHLLNEVGPPQIPSATPDSTEAGVTTRRMIAVESQITTIREPRQKFPLVLLPRLADNAIAANSLCFILHPEQPHRIVAEGRSGGSWKSPKQKFGSLCKDGEQMVQVHKILIADVPLMFIEDRQPFTLLDHALVKASGSSVYVKWMSKLLVKKTKTFLETKT